jgi:DNA replication and repair protein RecF
VNIIVGPNASGKTNLLEAILLVCLGKSYRGRDAELVQHEQPWARLDASVVGHNRVVKLEHEEHLTKKSFVIDDQDVHRLTLPKTIPAVVFEPNHLFMLIGSPEGRRAFLDDLLSQTVHGYGTLLRSYKRTLAQRNNLLKQLPARGHEQLFVWDVRLSELGAQIYSARVRLLEQINQQASTIYSDLAQTPSTLTFEYSVGVLPENYASHLLHHLEKNYELDVLRGFTGAGPHREDMVAHLNGELLSQTGSRGEHRSALLTLKIIELGLVTGARDQTPLLLLDDVFSELDNTRRRALTTHLKNHQTFITTTDADAMARKFLNKCNIVSL